MNNPNRVNEEYIYLNRAKPSIADNFKKDLHFTDLWSILHIDNLIDDITIEIKKATQLGVKLINKLFNRNATNSGLVNKYLEQRLEEQNGLFRGSMLFDTKKQIITLIKQAIDESWTIEKLVFRMNVLSRKLFGKAMATTVAITEIHRAFETGKYIAIGKLRDEGKIIQKYWQTCNDDRVRETHMQAQKEGRVDIDYIYNSMGVKCPPGGYNCRCNLIYKEL